jgi:membrane protease YdiL (CAAX protease family)
MFVDVLNIIIIQILHNIIKIIIWTLPSIFLINHYKDDMWISLKEMFTNKFKWFDKNKLKNKQKCYEFEKEPLIVFFLLSFIIPLRALFSYRKLEIHPDFQLIKIIEYVLFVGITEEVAFRGWLLNAMLKKMKLWNSIILDNLLFYFMHFPFWIYLGYDISKILFNIMGIFGIGIIFAVVFIKSKNIFVPILLHMLWNSFVLLFYGIN